MTSAMKPKAGGPRGNVDIILDKLQPTILTHLFGSPTSDDSNAIHSRRRRASLVARAEEALRLLNIKRVRLLKDNAMVRAALVIDYLSRTAPTYQEPTTNQYFQTTIPITMLADTIGFSNKKDRNKLQSMQMVIASYLDGTSIDQRKKVSDRNNYTQNHSRKRNHSDTEPILGTVNATKTTMIKPTSLMKQLCIQLGTMISDAEFVNSHALQLFREVQSATTTSAATTDTKRSKYELYKDIERNQVYYEAACFYLAVMKSEGDGSHFLIKGNNKKTSTERRKDMKTSKKENKLHHDMGDDDVEEYQHGFEEERSLNELDVIRAANLLEGTFRTILAFVQNWTKDSDMNRNRHSGSSNIGDGKGVSINGLFELPAENGRVDDDQGLRRNNSHCNAVFEVWKEKVLQQAKMSVQEQMKDGNSEGDWLSLAAEEVLKQAGLM